MDTEMHFMDRIGENTDPADCASCHVAICYAHINGFCTALEKNTGGENDMSANPDDCPFYCDAEENRRKSRIGFYQPVEKRCSP